MDLDFTKIEKSVEDLIKKKIIDKKLVSTGKMLNSIKVTNSKNGFTVNAVDYFYYIDKEYNILQEVYSSKAFIDLMTKQASDDLKALLK